MREFAVSGDMHILRDGARIFFEQLGEGPEVVLLHPTPVDHRFWLPAAHSLTPAYRVILPDLRGHGQSEAGEGTITVGRLAADTLSILDELGVRRALFIGCSIGSYTLYELWRRAPQRIAGLVFCCGKPQADTAENRARREDWIREIEQRGADAFFDRMLDMLVGKPSARRNPYICRELRIMMERMRPEAVIATQRGLMERPDSMATATTITVPAAVLAGELDGGSTPEEMKQLADAIPGSQLYVLSEMGHYAPYERPEVVGPLLRRFCDAARRVAT